MEEELFFYLDVLENEFKGETLPGNDEDTEDINTGNDNSMSNTDN